MLRLVSYNIHSGKDLFWRNRLEEMAETLASLDADIIGLQEVHQNEQYGYQASFLADRLNHEYAFGPALPIANGAYGNAILSRLPLVFSSTQLLPAKREPRSLLQASVKWESRFLDIWVTHLSLDKTSRKAQLQMLYTAMNRQKRENPFVLLGDFNSSAVHFLADMQDCARVKQMQQHSTIVPFAKRVDYIFASNHLSVAEYRRIHVKWSDHYPILVTLQSAAGQPPPAE